MATSNVSGARSAANPSNVGAPGGAASQAIPFLTHHEQGFLPVGAGSDIPYEPALLINPAASAGSLRTCALARVNTLCAVLTLCNAYNPEGGATATELSSALWPLAQEIEMLLEATGIDGLGLPLVDRRPA